MPSNRTKTAKKKHRLQHYDLVKAIRVYELARDGLSNLAIAKAMGVPEDRFSAWSTPGSHGFKPLIKEALDRGRAFLEKSGTSMADYILGRLSPKALRVWKELNTLEQAMDKSPGKDKWEREADIRAFCQGQNKRMRQHLYIYALLHSHYNQSEALERVCVSRQLLALWLRSDSKFKALVDEVNTHKGDFFETALIKLVERGEPSAILHVNKTFNRKRGYGDKLEVVHSGKVEHKIKVDELNLSLETRKELLRAIQEKRATAQIEDKRDVVDAEFEEKENVKEAS